MNEYLMFYKQRLNLSRPWDEEWDIFISAYNSSERVRTISERTKAKERYWLILPEYHYEASEYPLGDNVFTSQSDNETTYMSDFVAAIQDLRQKRLVIDISGFLNHYVLALVAALQNQGLEACDIIYGEPVRYIQSERTRFSDESVLDVRQVFGFEGIHTTDINNDLLIMGVGYDYRLVAEVINTKEQAKKVQLLGLPSLRPDMYQESLLRASVIAEAMGPEASLPQHFEFAPAHDPFITASILSDIVQKHRSSFPRANIYLSPLSTKPHALGFAIFYLRQCRDTATSIIYPFCHSYMKETSQGLNCAWKYHLELSRLTLERK